MHDKTNSCLLPCLTRYRHDQQNRWPHRVTTGSRTPSRQMLHSKYASSPTQEGQTREYAISIRAGRVDLYDSSRQTQWHSRKGCEAKKERGSNEGKQIAYHRPPPERKRQRKGYDGAASIWSKAKLSQHWYITERSRVTRRQHFAAITQLRITAFLLCI